MNCIKQIILTGYRVRYADLREPKPRPILETVHVLTVERLQKRRTTVDLLQLWEQEVAPE